MHPLSNDVWQRAQFPTKSKRDAASVETYGIPMFLSQA